MQGFRVPARRYTKPFKQHPLSCRFLMKSYMEIAGTLQDMVKVDNENEAWQGCAFRQSSPIFCVARSPGTKEGIEGVVDLTSHMLKEPPRGEPVDTNRTHSNAE